LTRAKPHELSAETSHSASLVATDLRSDKKRHLKIRA
jgi:hypothetical protein